MKLLFEIKLMFVKYSEDNSGSTNLGRSGLSSKADR